MHVVSRFYSGTRGSFFEKPGINDMSNLAYLRLDDVPFWSLGRVQVKATTCPKFILNSVHNPPAAFRVFAAEGGWHCLIC
jgi:hypothetical protein